MKYLSVCSGIEAASMAWDPLGWDPLAFAEIDPFASAVLAARYPNVPNLGDMTRYAEWPIKTGSVDVLVGGTPCQSFSVAGLRKGLADPRGNLALVWLGLIDRFKPRYTVWENVPGVLSSDGGRDFGALLGGMAQLGYGFAYRVLDAQFVRVESHPRAVPQRRRRVFVVGCAGGDWERAAEVISVAESVRGDPPTRRKAWQVASSGARSGAAGDRREDLMPEAADPISANEARTYTHEGNNFRTRNVVPDVVGFSSVLGTHGGDVFINVSPTLRVSSGGPNGWPPAVATPPKQDRRAWPAEVSPTLGATWSDRAPQTRNQEFIAKAGGMFVPDVKVLAARDSGQKYWLQSDAAVAVRRLTPRECERLQGFPDDYTLIDYRGKPAADGNRYKALGNSMAVNVMRWIGDRIAAVEAGERR